MQGITFHLYFFCRYFCSFFSLYYYIHDKWATIISHATSFLLPLMPIQIYITRVYVLQATNNGRKEKPLPFFIQNSLLTTHMIIYLPFFCSNFSISFVLNRRCHVSTQWTSFNFNYNFSQPYTQLASFNAQLILYGILYWNKKKINIRLSDRVSIAQSNLAAQFWEKQSNEK